MLLLCTLDFKPKTEFGIISIDVLRIVLGKSRVPKRSKGVGAVFEFDKYELYTDSGGEHRHQRRTESDQHPSVRSPNGQQSYCWGDRLSDATGTGKRIFF